ncbi:hypothetical protein ARMSODRAFT_289584 [Armillaria solidipes]|uniref:Uncharacterized protein n=1 Tax=Armillaria solidipes TaxID=1076256 RepID=A0A2H3C3D1_9AGAR|nr:hypothetical protein ARMSODRAFT_289584 [Armillaria solidipes]
MHGASAASQVTAVIALSVQDGPERCKSTERRRKSIVAIRLGLNSIASAFNVLSERKPYWPRIRSRKCRLKETQAWISLVAITLIYSASGPRHLAAKGLPKGLSVKPCRQEG